MGKHGTRDDLPIMCATALSTGSCAVSSDGSGGNADPPGGGRMKAGGSCSGFVGGGCHRGGRNGGPRMGFCGCGEVVCWLTVMSTALLLLMSLPAGMIQLRDALAALALDSAIRLSTAVTVVGESRAWTRSQCELHTWQQWYRPQTGTPSTMGMCSTNGRTLFHSM